MAAMLIPIIVMFGLALVFGILLSWASKRFKVEEKLDTQKLKKITALLPKMNCGRCGFPGCGHFAKAVLTGKAKYNGCVVGGEETAKKIKEIIER